MGLFGVSEILLNIESPARQVFDTRMSTLIPSREDLRRSMGAILRGTGIGLFLGLVPGIGTMVPTFISYTAERRISKTPEAFGTGMIEGVAGPETANNAYANGAMIPLFTLGIPASPTLAILMGALMMNGLVPGPLLFTAHSEFVWAVIASFVVGNVILLILNLPLIPMWVAVLKIPYAILFPLILGFAVVGAYSVDSSVFGIGVMVAFGVLGYAFKKLDIPMAPFALTLILGPMMEKALRQSLEMSGGSLSVFYARPLTATLLVIAAVLLVVNTAPLFSRVKVDTEV
jgi:putative tricarboxylic transport membrane protein